MANTSNAKISTDLNVAPYYDDFDEFKNYHRILFKPGYAVQGRELTQSQTILQNQIDKLGKHLFQEGSIVLPGAFTLETKSQKNAPYYVKVRDINAANGTVNINTFLGVDLTGNTSNVTAHVTDVLDGSESSTNTKTLIVSFTSVSNANASITTFGAGEVLSCNLGTLITLNTAPVGKSSVFRISEGVVFSKGHFISFPTQSVVLDRYNDNPTCKVGFFIDESIITSDADATLLDPALGSSNYSAPGADRLKLYPRLAVVAYDDPATAPEFSTLFTIKNGVITALNERTQYNILRDELAKRTYDESGDYYVRGLDIRIQEHLDDGSNYGYKTSANGGNSQFLALGVQPGLAYVKGYEVGTLETVYLATQKGLATTNVNTQLTSAVQGSYITIDETVGSLKLDNGVFLDLYDTAQNSISTKRWSNGGLSPLGKVIGNTKVQSIEHVSGTPGYNATYNLYISDLRMLGTNAFSNVRSVSYNNGATARFYGDAVIGTSNVAILNATNDSALLYYVGSNSTKSVRSPNDPATTDMFFTFDKTESVTVATGGTLTVTSSGGEIMPSGTSSSLSALQKSQILLSFNANSNISIGTASSGTGNTLTGSGTSFTRLNVGDKIELSSNVLTYQIVSITSDTVLNVDANLPAISANQIFKAYKIGDILDLTGKGVAAGATRVVSSTSTSLTVDLKESFAATVSATLTYPLTRTAALEVPKTLNPDRLVKIDLSTYSTTSGPFDLGFSDVYQIKKIIKKSGSFPTSLTDGTDVTTQFIFNNGQKDNAYEHATITPTAALSTSDRLLVSLDYFSPNFTSRFGYFSVDSYPVDDTSSANTTINTEQIPVYKSPVTGLQYDLRNYIDFRPIKTNTATDTVLPASATTNPSASANVAYTFGASGMRMPVPSSTISYDYSYYMGRKDLVVVDQDKNFSVIKGIPSLNPITPTAPDKVMVLAILTIAPYPSLAPNYAQILGRNDLATTSKRTASVRQTMRDIGVLKDRIVNLEYYTTLSLLEKSALDMKVLDSNGLDRFKNGIFVDTFNSHALGDTNSSDYRIVVDPNEKSIRPLYNMSSFYYDYVSGGTKNADIITLPYSEVMFANQRFVTTTRNTERTTWRFLGTLDLNPETDVWVDTQYAPDQTITFGDATIGGSEVVNETSGGVTTEWNAWQTKITGYAIYTGTGTNRTKVGEYNTRWEADMAAQQFRTSGSVTIETNFQNSRSGTENFLTIATETKSAGAKVVDVSIQPYIRPQTISIKANGLKPYAKMYVFFDGINMSSYCTPLVESEYNLSSGSRQRLISVEGASMRVDAAGNIFLSLRLPSEKRFTTGTKSIVVTDSPTNNADDATTVSTGYFVAQGLVQTKQETILSTRHVIPKQKNISETITGSTIEELPAVIIADATTSNQSDVANDRGGGECSAYSFIVKVPQGVDGIFLSSVDVFVSDKHPTLGVWFEIREIDAGGGITRNQVPFSAVWYKSSEVPLSTDGKTNPLNVKFKAPVFLQRNTQYAFIIHPEAGNPNYYLWVSRLGQTDINTGLPVTTRGFAGTFYMTNNDLNWVMVPDVDLTCNFYRASFSTSPATVLLGNKPVEMLRVNRATANFNRYGETIVSGDRLVLANIAGGTIANTDLIIGANSSINSSVIYINGYYAMSNTGYVAGENVTVRFANATSKGVTATVSSITNGRAVLDKYSAGVNVAYMTLVSSNGIFAANDAITNYTTHDNARVVSVDNIRYSVVDLEPSYLNFSKTNITWEMKTYSNTGTVGSFVTMSPNDNYHFVDERALFSRSNEVASLSGDKSNQVRVTLSTSSEYLSPVIDIGRTHAVYVDTLINADYTNEANTSGGNLYNKYISKTITLADGQDAEDLQVVLTAYRPPSTNSDVKVWVKILHAEDSDSLAQRPWIELEKTGSSATVYSSLADMNDFKEYTYKFPAANTTGPLGEVQYTNSQNIKFTGFKYYSVKIGLLGDNSAIVPRVADLRAIALQM